MKNRSEFSKLSFYVGREYLFSFLIAFVFFFFIFFVNQILVIAQKIVIKNVEFSKVLSLVILSIPQFLLYTMPFSSLASASMVIGSFSSQNEILAIRASGIHTRRVFFPILIISLLFSAATLLISDRMIPYTAEKYKDLYSEVLSSMPTLELESYSSSQFGNRVVSTGLVDGNTIYDIVVFDNEDPEQSKVVSSPKANITLLDLDRLLYRIDFENPSILITNTYSGASYTSSEASDMSLYISLSSNSDSYYEITPSRMSIRQLMEETELKRLSLLSEEETNKLAVLEYSQLLGDKLVEIEEAEKISGNSLNNAVLYADTMYDLLNQKSSDFFYQYYRSELWKKIALSIACTCLVVIAFPISFVKLKYGKLFGFGLSMLVACLYWFFIYFMHSKAIYSSVNPFIFLHLPNFTVLVIGLILLVRMQKK